MMSMSTHVIVTFSITYVLAYSVNADNRILCSHQVSGNCELERLLVHTAHRLWDIESRQHIPGRHQGEHHCGGNLEAGGQVRTHNAHMCEVVQSQKIEQQKPEELACMHSKGQCLLRHTHVATVTCDSGAY